MYIKYMVPSKKERWVMFDAIANTYDQINRCITFGFDIYWRNAMVSKISKKAFNLLDVASGTMDVAITAAKKCKQLTSITALDMAKDMLSIGEEKCQKKGIKMISSLVADVHHLPFNAQSYDAVTVSFGIRNFEKLDAAFKEVHRVLKTGGELIILESCQPKNPFMRVLNNLYLRWWVQPIGGIMSGKKAAYSYLMETIETFSTPEELSEMLKSAGFSTVNVHLVMFQSVQMIYAIK